MVFRKAGRLRSYLNFTYDNQELEIITHFTYLGIRFRTTASFSATQQMLADQAQKALFKVYQYRNSFVNISIGMELFDRLILAILCYSSEVWGFHTTN